MCVKLESVSFEADFFIKNLYDLNEIEVLIYLFLKYESSGISFIMYSKYALVSS
jgi:hypothetical protein